MKQLFITLTLLLSVGSASADNRVKDADYGAALFQFYQQNYFDTLIEFEIAERLGGIQGHGQLPGLVRGGVNLSYGMERLARDVFEQSLANLSDHDTSNRAWLFIARIHYERGDLALAQSQWQKIAEPVAKSIRSEVLYLGTLIHLQLNQFAKVSEITAIPGPRDAYRPYIEFNAALADISQENFLSAIDRLESTIKLASEDEANRWALADRAYLALAQIYTRLNDTEAADKAIANVRADGPYAKPAKLNQAWTLSARGDLASALKTATEMTDDSIAYPETQEALLLRAHLYEDLKLKGRALLAFNEAATRYQEGYRQIEVLQASLNQDDLLNTLVDNLEDTVTQTDWFGEPPALKSQAITPFLYQLMATNRFQSLLKDLRDLYAIRLNLQNWQSKRSEFDLILAAQNRTVDGQSFTERAAQSTDKVRAQRKQLQALLNRISELDEQQQEQAETAIKQIQKNIREAEARADGISLNKQTSIDSQAYQARIDSVFARVDQKHSEIESTISKLEQIILQTIDANLARQVSRIKLYEVQARLARARLLDAELVNKYSYQTTAPALPDATEAEK